VAAVSVTGSATATTTEAPRRMNTKEKQRLEEILVSPTIR
jgi:hypothetical protein